MKMSWLNLNEREQASFRAAVVFLEGRLGSRATINWALDLDERDLVKRMAIQELLSHREGAGLAEPWRSAWRLVEESWAYSISRQQFSSDAYRLQNRLFAGEKSGALIDAIVELVAPRLKVESKHEDNLAPRGSARPRDVNDLVRASLISPRASDIRALRFERIDDLRFLLQLANALDAAVEKGLDIARRLGWDGESRLWRLGQMYRVEFVGRSGDDGDVDDFHSGIVASVKILLAVVKRIAEIEVETAAVFANYWLTADDPIHLRMWASISKNSLVTKGPVVAQFLTTATPMRFWNLHDFPEIAELRAVRFADLAGEVQQAIVRRIQAGPPRSLFRNANAAQIREAREFWSARELRRIQVAGGELPKRAARSLAESFESFPQLRTMESVDEGFLTSGSIRWVGPNPDSKLDLLSGALRLQAIETALATPARSWEDDPEERATDWIRAAGNSQRLLEDFLARPSDAKNYPLTWERFGWSHQPIMNDETADQVLSEGENVLALISELPNRTLEIAINGLSHWLSSWSRLLISSADMQVVWHKMWPVAVRATNSEVPPEDEVQLDVVAPAPMDGDEFSDLDTLNTPAGRMVGVFLEACPNLEPGAPNPFERDEQLRAMRSAVIAATGRSGLIARHRLIESLNYFLKADDQWARENLIAPLAENDASALALWRAIARRTQFRQVLSIIGTQAADRATDRRLNRDTRSSLLSSLVVEALHALLGAREPVVAISRIQQAIRTVDDEVRANAAGVVGRFLDEMGNTRARVDIGLAVEEIFERSVRPFLQGIWPQERSLTTPGVAEAFASLPALSGDEFAGAVDAIERFLVPFNCWSMADYGLWGEQGGQRSLDSIDTRMKAEALLKLLDATVGTADGSIIPMDLGEALDQVRTVAPELAATPAFRRLGTAARRR